MRQKNAFAGDREKTIPKFLVGQDVIDAEVDIVFVLLHK